MKLRIIALFFLLFTNSCRTNKPIAQVSDGQEEKKEESDFLFVYHEPLNLTASNVVDFKLDLVNFGEYKIPKIEVQSTYDLYFYKVCEKGKQKNCSFGSFTQDSHFLVVYGQGEKDVYVSACNMPYRTMSKDVSCIENWGKPQTYMQSKAVGKDFSSVVATIEQNEMQFFDMAIDADATFRVARDELKKCDNVEKRELQALDSLISQGPAVLADNLRFQSVDLSYEQGLSLTALRSIIGRAKGIRRQFENGITGTINKLNLVREDSKGALGTVGKTSFNSLETSSSSQIGLYPPVSAKNINTEIIEHGPQNEPVQTPQGRLRISRNENPNLAGHAQQLNIKQIKEKPPAWGVLLKEVEAGAKLNPIGEIGKDKKEIIPTLHKEVMENIEKRKEELEAKSETQNLGNKDVSEEEWLESENNLVKNSEAKTPAKTPAETPAETPAKTPAETLAKTPAETLAEFSKVLKEKVQEMPLKRYDSTARQAEVAAEMQKKGPDQTAPGAKGQNDARNVIPDRIVPNQVERINRNQQKAAQSNTDFKTPEKEPVSQTPEKVLSSVAGAPVGLPKKIEPLPPHVPEAISVPSKPFIDRHGGKLLFGTLLTLGAALAVASYRVQENNKTLEESNGLTGTCAAEIKAETVSALSDIVRDADDLRAQRLALYLTLESKYLKANGW